MLSGETAYGKYPVEAVKTMAKIAAQAEKDKLAENDIRIPLDENSNDVTAFLAKQAVKATSKLNIRAIITDSFSGRTARNIAAFRGKYPVLDHEGRSVEAGEQGQIVIRTSKGKPL